MRYIGKWFFIYVWHGINLTACKWVEMHRPYDKEHPILWTCQGCGRTESEYQ